MRLTLLLIALVAGMLITSQAEAATRFGFGWGWPVVKDKYDERQEERAFRYSLEQELGEHWSFEGNYESTLVFTDSDSFSNVGFYAKYRFSPKKYTFYTKFGPHRYTYFSKSKKENRVGVGALGAVGWQYVGESNWGISLETWYSKMGRDDAYGATLTVSYGFNRFN